MNRQFEKLIQDFCAAAKLPDFQQIMSGAPFDYDGVLFGFSYDAKLTPELMLIHTDFGAPSVGLKGPVYYTLLEENFISALDTSDAGSGTFGLSTSSGNVVYIKRFELVNATPSNLAQAIKRLAQQAKHWRQTQFLDEPVSSPALAGDVRTPSSSRVRMRQLFDPI